LQAEEVAQARPHGLSRRLVRQVAEIPGCAAPRIDAIVVPTNRPAAYLGFAASLAAEAGARLVVMCSGSARAQDIGGLMTGQTAQEFIGVQVPDGFSHPLVGFLSSHDGDAAEGRQGDISLKRNLGLLMGRAMRWRRLLFLDDDTRGIGTVDLVRASLLLRSTSAVGFFIDEFPDHSVVGHALRLAQATQQTFVSGGALMVDPSAPAPFFPDIYNEDWLFLCDWTRRRRLTSAGYARQLAYAPFDDPARAHREEFGDLLAEGLHQLIDQGRRIRDAGTAFWAGQLAERRQRITWSAEAVRRSTAVSDALRERVVIALRAAVARLDQINPASPGRFIDAWRGDLRVWAARYREIPPLGSLAKALDQLSLAAEVTAPVPRQDLAPLASTGGSRDCRKARIANRLEPPRYVRAPPAGFRSRRRRRRGILGLVRAARLVG